jgi:hypothetical protein
MGGGGGGPRAGWGNDDAAGFPSGNANAAEGSGEDWRVSTISKSNMEFTRDPGLFSYGWLNRLAIIGSTAPTASPLVRSTETETEGSGPETGAVGGTNEPAEAAMAALSTRCFNIMSEFSDDLVGGSGATKECWG